MMPGAGLNIARLHFRTLEKMGLFVDADWINRNDMLFAGTGPNTTNDLMDMGQGIARYKVNALDAQAAENLMRSGQIKLSNSRKNRHGYPNGRAATSRASGEEVKFR